MFVTEHVSSEKITMGLISKIGWAIDSTVMSGVNKAVYAWNWTTGKTKASLANTISNTATITIGSSMITEGFLEDEHILYMTPFAIPLWLIVNHIRQWHNGKMEKLEEKAIQLEAKDLEVEKYKEVCRSSGYAQPLMGLMLASSKEQDFFPYSSLLGLGIACYGISDQIMRADYLPPRKNCLSRARDKIIQIAKDFSRRPVPSGIEAYLDYNS